MKKIAIVSLLICGCIIATSCRRKSIEEQFAENARQDTQQMCPRKIDDCTVLDSIVFDTQKRIQYYYYSLSAHLDDPKYFTEYFIADLRESMLKSLRNEIKLKKQMEAEIGFNYVYHSKSTGKVLLEIPFTKADYTGPLKLRSFNERITGKWEDYTSRFCPEVQDECATLTKVQYDSVAKAMKYEFELGGILDTDSFSTTYPNAEIEMKRVLTKNIQKNSSLTEEIDSCLDFSFTYVSKRNGRKMLDIQIKGGEIKK